MRPTTAQPFTSMSWTITLLIGLVFVGLEYGLMLEIEGTGFASRHSWLDLAFVLGGYLFMFCLKPIQKAIRRKMCRKIAHKAAR